MKNSNIVPTTNTTSKSSKVSFSDRLLMGEDIESIVNEDKTPTTAENISQPIESDETAIETIETIETPAQRAERGTVKRATLELFTALKEAGEVKQENWAQIAVDRGICKNVRQAANILRYDFLQIVRIPLDGTIINRTSLTVEQATEKASQMRRETIEKALQMIKDAKERGASLIERAKESEAKKAEQDEKIAAQSVKKAGEVLKSLESIDTSKVELTPEMRAMMLKMLGMEAV